MYKKLDPTVTFRPLDNYKSQKFTTGLTKRDF